MQRCLIAVAMLALGILMCSVSGVGIAQEEEETGYSWGTVSSISSNQIVVSEHDYYSDEKIDITYSVDSDVELRNTDSLEDIAVGDSVAIEYVVQDGKNVAKTITVEETSNEEDTTPEALEERAEFSP